MYTPPGTPRSRSFTRFTIRVGFPHFGQFVDFDVSITFSRLAILAILAMGTHFSWSVFAHTQQIRCAATTARPQLLHFLHRDPTGTFLGLGGTIQKNVDSLSLFYSTHGVFLSAVFTSFAAGLAAGGACAGVA